MNVNHQWQKLKKYVQNLNLFPSIPASTNESILQQQRTSTRLFLLLLIWFLLILTLYNSLIKITKSITVNDPTSETYFELFSKYTRTLTCPCRKIAIDYRNLVNISYTFHQLCTSDFISEKWIGLLPGSEVLTSKDDFRGIAPYLFRGLATFCESVNTTIVDSLDSFYTRQYIGDSLVSFDLFKSQMDSQVIEFISSTTKTYLLSLSMIRSTTQSNALFSAYQTNYIFTAGDTDLSSIRIIPTTYDNCNCMITAECIDDVPIRREATHEILYKIPGLKIGCYITEALMESTLECLFIEECIDQIRYYVFPLKLFPNLTILNSSLKSKYLPNTKLKIILDQLMIEQWNWSIIYKSYYEQCQPYQCTFTFETRNDLIFIVTVIIGLIGGLVTLLKLIIPFVIQFILDERQSQTSITSKIFINNKNIFFDHFLKIVQNFFDKLKNLLLNLNLFGSIPPTTDPNILKTEKISTKLFLILFVSSIFIIIIYISFTIITSTIYVQNPTIEQYFELYSKYSDELTCSCNQISIDYQKIVSITFTLHQVCTNDLINGKWMQNINHDIVYHVYDIDEFPSVAPSMFQSLNALCQLVNKTILDNLNRFYLNHYISPSLTSKHILQLQIDSFANQFKLSTIETFLLSLDIIRNTTQANGLTSALETNYKYYMDISSLKLMTNANLYSNCDCSIDLNCAKPTGFKNHSNNHTMDFIVPGMYTACYPIQGLIQSSLQCFYSEQCIENVMSKTFMDSSIYPASLDSSLTSRYLPNTSIETILNQLMIEQWNINNLYENYYTQCQPYQCTYSIKHRNHFIYIITTITGLIGGLVTVLKLISPLIIKLIRKNFRSTIDQPGNLLRIRTIFQQLKQLIENLNLFPTVSSLTDPDTVRKEKLATKVYIILLIVGISILSLYTYFMIVVKTVHIQNPKIDEYTQLYLEYEEQLICPCKKLSINYEEIISIRVTMHQLCSSHFITNDWLRYIKSTTINLNFDDFRSFSIYTFETLQILCQLVNRTINTNLKNFYSNQYISSSITSRNLLQTQIDSLFTQLIISMEKTFLQTFQLIRSMIYQNALTSATSTSHHLINVDLLGIPLNFFIARSRIWSECDCAITANCIQSATIYNHTNNNIISTVAGMFIGCYIIEATLQSTLECLYDQICLQMITSHVNNSSTIQWTILNSTEHQNQTIQLILNKLMVEKWNWSINYENYYEQCQPNECRYTYKTRNHFLYIFTTIIGLIGGLTTALRFATSNIFLPIFKYIQRKKNKIFPIV